jgi:hypothetical protein
MYHFTFSDQSGDAGYGTLNAVPSGLADSLVVTSGSLTVTSGGATGTYSLIPTGPYSTYSPLGAFIVDDVIYPNNDAANGVNPGISGGPSYLTYWGLLFGGSGAEVNIFAYPTGGGNYEFYKGTGPGIYSVGAASGVSFSLTPVPEPASLTLLGVGACGLLGYGWRRKKAAPAR